MATVNVYLTFNGTCEEAFNFYKSIFGGEFNAINRYSEIPEPESIPLTESDKNRLMHIGLPISKETILMGADNIRSNENNTAFGNNFSIMIMLDSREEADRVFKALLDGGRITMPLEEQFWGDYMGALTDKFGINWLVTYEPPQV